eukprot:TRINITY_DN4768_c0_g1_i1.p1 TRINITY_DN4768_c0_g1~~TRINITY_DN4768_c0_g1_i1.p1  ORF type:complete len:139 (-),score=22.88 TRINITY_DN4768_c0_g1_i1:16-432(-)
MTTGTNKFALPLACSLLLLCVVVLFNWSSTTSVHCFHSEHIMASQQQQQHEGLEADHPAHSEFAVQLPEGADPDTVAEQHGFLSKGPIGSLPNFYLFEMLPQHRTKRDVADSKLQGLADSSQILWHEQQVPRSLSKRD